MKFEDAPSNAAEIPSLEKAEKESVKNESRLRKIGGKVFDIAYNYGLPSVALYGMTHTLDPSLPPQYTIPASIVGGSLLHVGGEQFNKMRAKRRERKNTPKGPELTDSSSPVV